MKILIFGGTGAMGKFRTENLELRTEMLGRSKKLSLHLESFAFADESLPAPPYTSKL